MRREAATRPIYQAETIEVWHIDPAFLDALEKKLDRNTSLEILRNDGTLYVTIDGVVVEGALLRHSLVEE